MIRSRPMNTRWVTRLLWMALLTSAGTACAKGADANLPELKIDPARTAVVGLSSGAYMAAQGQLAYPELFPNAARVAGGTFGCAGAKLDVALRSCMSRAEWRVDREEWVR